MQSNQLQQAYRYCQWLTCRHYENFPVASWLLPAAKRPHVAALYAFARSADDFSDEARYQGQGLALLNQWRQALHSCSNGSSDSRSAIRDALFSHPIFLALADTIRRCQLPIELLDDLLTAFTMDVTKKRHANWEELLTYCRYSANPVGRLVLKIFGYQDAELERLSDAICTGLQLANHWQDLIIDLGKDRWYIPQELIHRFGLSEKEIIQMASHPPLYPGFRRLMQELVARARALFDEGEPLPHRVKGRLRLELKLTLLGGRAILEGIERADYDVFRKRPVITSLAKCRLLTHALLS